MRIDEPGAFGPAYRDGFADMRFGEPDLVRDLQEHPVLLVERDLHVDAEEEGDVRGGVERREVFDDSRLQTTGERDGERDRPGRVSAVTDPVGGTTAQDGEPDPGEGEAKLVLGEG